MDPDVGRDVLDRWMKGMGAVITGLVVRLERSLFFSAATLH